MITFLAFRIFTVLNRFFRAPLKTGKTLFTLVLPGGFPFGHHNISGRTKVRANPAGSALLVGKEGFIHLGHIR